MGKVIAGMSMSLDGFVNDRSGSVERLYPDFEALRQSEQLQESMRMTGAVVMGRNAFAMGDPDWYAHHYEYQVPIFVLTHEPPSKHPKQGGGLTFTFVTDGIESAITQAKAAAGDKDVTVIGGASTIQQCLRAGLVDELEVDVIPVILGQGLRLFEHLETAQIALAKLSVIDMPTRTSLRFRVASR